MIQTLGNGKEAPANACLDLSAIANRQGASEGTHLREKPTQPEPTFESRAVYTQKGRKREYFMTSQISQGPTSQVSDNCRHKVIFSASGTLKNRVFREILGPGERVVSYIARENPEAAYNISMETTSAGQKALFQEDESSSISKNAGAALNVSVGPIGAGGAEAKISKAAKGSHAMNYAVEASGEFVVFKVSGGHNGSCCSGERSTLKISLVIQCDPKVMQEPSEARVKQTFVESEQTGRKHLEGIEMSEGGGIQHLLLEETKRRQTIKPVTLPFEPSMAFGVAEWNKYFGDARPAPQLPANIEATLNGPCPIYPGYTIGQTHMLALIPQTVNGALFSLNVLGKLVQTPKGGGHKTQYDVPGSLTRIMVECGDKAAGPSHWVLMLKKVVPDSTNKTYADQKKLVEALSQRTGVVYRVPELLEAITCVFLERVRFGTYLYDVNSPWARCRGQIQGLQVAFGAYAESGLRVYTNTGAVENGGITAVREV